MDTMTTVEAVERTPSGAFKITLLGGAVAGTYDEEIGALAEKLAAAGDEGNPAAVVLDVQDGKTFIRAMREILPPEELGGVADEDQPAAVGEDTQGAEDAPAEAVEATESNAAQEDAPVATLESAMLETCSDEDLLAEVARRLAR